MHKHTRFNRLPMITFGRFIHMLMMIRHDRTRSGKAHIKNIHGRLQPEPKCEYHTERELYTCCTLKHVLMGHIHTPDEGYMRHEPIMMNDIIDFPQFTQHE